MSWHILRQICLEVQENYKISCVVSDTAMIWTGHLCYSFEFGGWERQEHSCPAGSLRSIGGWHDKRIAVVELVSKKFVFWNTGTIRQDHFSCTLHKGDSLVICIAVILKLVGKEGKLTGSSTLRTWHCEKHHGTKMMVPHLYCSFVCKIVCSEPKLIGSNASRMWHY